MLLSEHFTLEEFVQSDTAARLGIDNSMPSYLLQNAVDACLMLERVRSLLSAKAGKDVPIIISSGYRCEALNKAIGGAKSSDHLMGFAVDFKAPSFGTPKDIAKEIASNRYEIVFGQLIYEYESWVHISINEKITPTNSILTINKSGVHQGII